MGRTRELAALLDAYHDSQQGKPVATVVVGESGIGKSALVRQFLDERALDQPPPLVLSAEVRLVHAPVATAAARQNRTIRSRRRKNSPRTCC